MGYSISNLEPLTRGNNRVSPNKNLSVVGVLHYNRELRAYLWLFGGPMTCMLMIHLKWSPGISHDHSYDRIPGRR